MKVKHTFTLIGIIAVITLAFLFTACSGVFVDPSHGDIGGGSSIGKGSGNGNNDGTGNESGNGNGQGSGSGNGDLTVTDVPSGKDSNYLAGEGYVPSGNAGTLYLHIVAEDPKFGFSVHAKGVKLTAGTIKLKAYIIGSMGRFVEYDGSGTIPVNFKAGTFETNPSGKAGTAMVVFNSGKGAISYSDITWTSAP